jgi:DNA-binding GntR family transcriptional regulator
MRTKATAKRTVTKAKYSRPDSLPTLASAVYDRLRADILSGELAPGSKLRIEFLRRRYQTGSSPIREALNRLSSDGLIDRKEQRGFFVAQVSADDLRELTQTRCWLEGLALRESMAAHPVEWEEQIVLSTHRLSRVPRSSGDPYLENPEWERLHREFHRSLISACGSRWLRMYCGQLGDQAYRYRQLAMQSNFPKRDEQKDHRAIMDAAIGGRVDEAVRLLTAHFRRTADIILKDRGALEPDGARHPARRSKAVRAQPGRRPAKAA